MIVTKEIENSVIHETYHACQSPLATDSGKTANSRHRRDKSAIPHEDGAWSRHYGKSAVRKYAGHRARSKENSTQDTEKTNELQRNKCKSQSEIKTEEERQ